MLKVAKRAEPWLALFAVTVIVLEPVPEEALKLAQVGLPLILQLSFAPAEIENVPVLPLADPMVILVGLTDKAKALAEKERHNAKAITTANNPRTYFFVFIINKKSFLLNL